MKFIQKVLKNACEKSIRIFVSMMVGAAVFVTYMDTSERTLQISSAKTAFETYRPLGVMATAVGKKVAVSWEAVQGADGYEVYETVLEHTEDGTVKKEACGFRTFLSFRSTDFRNCHAKRKAKQPGLSAGKEVYEKILS